MRRAQELVGERVDHAARIEPRQTEGDDLLEPVMVTGRRWQRAAARVDASQGRVLVKPRAQFSEVASWRERIGAARQVAASQVQGQRQVVELSRDRNQIRITDLRRWAVAAQQRQALGAAQQSKRQRRHRQVGVPGAALAGDQRAAAAPSRKPAAEQRRVFAAVEDQQARRLLLPGRQHQSHLLVETEPVEVGAETQAVLAAAGRNRGRDGGGVGAAQPEDAAGEGVATTMDDLDRQLGLADAAGTADGDVDRRRAAVQMPGDGQQLGGAADKMRVWRKGRARAGRERNRRGRKVRRERRAGARRVRPGELVATGRRTGQKLP
jgi:hypothetical protein